MSQPRATDLVSFHGWREFLDALPDAACIVGKSEWIVTASQRLYDLTGYPPDTLDGRHLDTLLPGDRDGAGCRRADGSVFPISITRSPLPEHRDWAVVVIRDDTDRQRTEADLFRQATHDSLTGLANRALLLDRLERIERRRRTQLGPLTVLFVDLDHFKQVNDVHGHAAGDEVLQVVADALERTFRPSDTVARVGGDEFVVLCEDTGADDGTALAARATAAVRAAARALAYSASQDVSASVGVVCAKAEGEEPMTLIERADAAMYVAKRRGGDQVFRA